MLYGNSPVTPQGWERAFSFGKEVSRGKAILYDKPANELFGHLIVSRGRKQNRMCLLSVACKAWSCV